MNAVMKRRLLRKRIDPPARSGRARGWLLGLLALGTVGAAAGAIALGTVFAVYQSYHGDYVPIEEHLRQVNVGLTEVYDRGGVDGGVLLGSLSNPQADLLEPVRLDEVSNWVIEATISTEDNTFWDHPGVSYQGLMRAAYENYFVHDFSEGTGGSTITQQLVKNVYICPNIVLLGSDQERCLSADRTLDRKLREITYAIELESQYTKEQILGWYLNQISYADRYIGIQAAAKGYFRKDAADLNLAEAALLAGIPAAPGAYHPRDNCLLVEGGEGCVVDGLGRTLVSGLAKQRQEDVLNLMVVHGRATPAQAAEAKAYDLRVYPVTHELRAPAFIDNQVEPQLVRMCEQGVLPLVEGIEDCQASVRSAGYQVVSTLDWAETQRATELIREQVAAGLEAGCNCHNAAIVTIEPATGQIMVYAPNIDPTNLADPRVRGDIDQHTEINQPGSSFKPAVYLAWFDYANQTPMSHLWDTSPLVIGDEDEDGPSGGAEEDDVVEIVNPRPGSFKSEGLISARAALGGSQNVPAFRAAVEAGVDNVVLMAKRLGITTLHQGFDPTFSAHDDVTYGASIATGGANIRAVDLAYMFSVIANMGVMVGVPHGAEYVDPADMRSTSTAEGADYDLALQQRTAFTRGHIRLPGTRELDPVVILEVRDHLGNVIFQQGEPERRQVVDAGSVWMLHSIMSDCEARFIIWSCGSSNSDLALDFHFGGAKIESGVKTGTQQGPLSAADTLETWTTGYTRYAATVVWVGNANNELVLDGPSADYASARTTLWLYKHWMEEFHRYQRDDRGVFTMPEGFEELMPANVTYGDFKTPITERGKRGGCNQEVHGWQRTDVDYPDPCVNGRVPLPEFKPDAARKLVNSSSLNIPIQGVSPAAAVALSRNDGEVEDTDERDDDEDSGATQPDVVSSTGNADGDGSVPESPTRPRHPIGLQECSNGCDERPLRLICGPDGWFADNRNDFANTEGWPEGAQQHNEQLLTAVTRVCGGP